MDYVTGSLVRVSVASCRTFELFLFSLSPVFEFSLFCTVWVHTTTTGVPLPVRLFIYSPAHTHTNILGAVFYYYRCSANSAQIETINSSGICKVKIY